MKELRTLVFMSAALFTVACGDRLASIDETPFEPLCLRSWGVMGYWIDGRQWRVQHEGKEGASSPYACACITEEQFWDEAEIERLTDKLLEELLITCERSAALQGFDWDDCQADYDGGTWRFAHLGIGKLSTPFSCGGEGWAGDTEDDELPICELGDPGCSCTIEAVCTGGSTCIDGMCQTPP